MQTRGTQKLEFYDTTQGKEVVFHVIEAGVACSPLHFETDTHMISYCWPSIFKRVPSVLFQAYDLVDFNFFRMCQTQAIFPRLWDRE